MPGDLRRRPRSYVLLSVGDENGEIRRQRNQPAERFQCPQQAPSTRIQFPSAFAFFNSYPFFFSFWGLILHNFPFLDWPLPFPKARSDRQSSSYGQDKLGLASAERTGQARKFGQLDGLRTSPLTQVSTRTCLRLLEARWPEGPYRGPSSSPLCVPSF